MSTASMYDDIPEITMDSMTLNLGCDEISISAAWSTNDNISLSLSLDTKSSFGKSIKKARSIVPLHTANIKRPAYRRKDSNETIKYHSLPEIMQKVKNEYENEYEEPRFQIRPIIYLFLFTSSTLLCFLFLSTVTLQLPKMNIAENTIGSTAQRMTSTLDQFILLLQNIEQNKRDIDKLQKNILPTPNRHLRITSDISKTNEHIKKELLPHLQKTYRLNQRKIQAMIDLIQRDSYRDIFEKYGHGPHSIELILRQDESQDKQLESIIVDLESIDVMPHTVHLFIEQIYHDLWKGAILKNTGIDIHTDLQADEKLDEFESLGLSSLHFLEKNEMLQSLAESDGVFLCYVNNGPNLQLIKDFQKTTGPCFGKLSSGESLQRLFTATPMSTLVIENARIINLQMHAGLSYTAAATRDMKDKTFLN